MTILISLFLISLLSVSIMFSKRLAVLENGTINIHLKNNSSFEIPFVLEVKHITLKKIKRGGYIGTVTIIRFYFRSINLLKRNFNKLKEKINNLFGKETLNSIENKKTNGFLKVVSDYKHKIRKIKHEVKKEEGIK